VSYYGIDRSYYQNIPAGTPGWKHAPVPGWGMNVARSGPPRISMSGDVVEEPYQYGFGHVALGFVAGSLFGAAAVYAYMAR
jgi:hypothetical protein